MSLTVDVESQMDETEQQVPIFMRGSEQVGERFGVLRAAEVLGIVANEQLRRLEKKGIKLEGMSFSSVRFVKSEDDLVVQAADLIANFGLAYLRSKIRTDKGTATEQAKANLFRMFLEKDPDQAVIDSWRNELSVDSKRQLRRCRSGPLRVICRSRGFRKSVAPPVPSGRSSPEAGSGCA